MPIPVGTTYPSALVSLDDVYTHLQIPASNQTTALGTQLQGFIDAATSVIQDITGPIIAQTFYEVYDGNGPTIALQNPPVLSVTSVVEYVASQGYTLTQVSLGDDTGQYCFSLDEPSTGIITRRYNSGLVGDFAAGVQNVAVTYVAGQSSVDPEIRMATLLDIQGLFNQTQQGGRPDFNGGDSSGGWTSAPMNLFPRLMSVLQAPKQKPVALA